MRITIARAFAAGCAVMLVVACGETKQGSAPPAEGREPSLAPLPPVTSHDSPQALPEGHPPIGDAAQPSVPPPPPGSGTGSSGLRWDVPRGWIEETPSSSMRRAQYRVPGPQGDSECVVFYFGPGQGGDPRANALRWASQFRQPDGRDPAEALVTTEIEVAGLPVTLVEITGTYANLMVNDAEMPGYMLLGAIAPGPDANWFFKLTGPEGSVRAQRDDFEELTRSIRKSAR